MAADLYIDFLGEAPWSTGDEPLEVEGRVKLAVQFLQLLFTAEGSDPTDLDRGTGLASLVGGNVGDLTDASDVLALAMDQAVEWLRGVQTGQGLPDDERLRNAWATRIEPNANGDGISATIVIENELGDLVPVRIPLR